jgi:hypothetical protein
MKAIRLFAAGLLLFSGVLHLVLAIKDPSDPMFVISLIVGIVYFTLGVLIALKKRIAIWLGFILPVIALALSPFMADFKTLDAWEWIILAIDLPLVLSCLVLLVKRRK